MNYSDKFLETDCGSIDEKRRQLTSKIGGGTLAAVWVTPLLTAVTLPAHSQTSFMCSDFPLTEGTNWYETSLGVPLSTFGTIQLVIVLRNDTVSDFSIVRDFQLWSTPSVIEDPTLPVTINSITTGIIAPGETVTYDLTIDVSGLPDTEIGLGFRGTDDNLFGNIRPNIASIVSSSIECT